MTGKNKDFSIMQHVYIVYLVLMLGKLHDPYQIKKNT